MLESNKYPIHVLLKFETSRQTLVIPHQNDIYFIQAALMANSEEEELLRNEKSLEVPTLSQDVLVKVRKDILNSSLKNQFYDQLYMQFHQF